MLRETLFRMWDPAWIVHEDEHLIVVDKPAGMASQAADQERPFDLPSRLGRFLRERGEASHLGVHQRLDQETSGLVVLSRTREASASLAKQMESREVEKKYVACVMGWRSREVVLRDSLVMGDEGRMVVARPGDRRGKPAVTRVRLVECVQERAMLELTLETGRTHQARVQLAHARSAIAGDSLYDGPRAPRLLLHASELGITHPSGRKLTFKSKPPADFASWMAHGDPGEHIYDDAAALARALHRAAERRFGLAHGTGTTAFRLVNEEGDALPGLAVDVYDDWLVAQLHGERAWKDRLLDALAATGAKGVYVKLRPKQANVIAKTDAYAPKLPVRGEAAPDELPIVEEGIPFVARLGDGLSTGIFLDQRGNRKRVREAARGKRVLNLFSYTCGFSIAAAVGGAKGTVSVDASLAALERGRAGMTHAGVALGPAHVFVAEDAFSWLARAGKKGERFDLAILDPPSYSSTKSRRFVAETDYAELAALVIRVLGPGGQLLACTNHRGIGPGKFRRLMFDALRSAGRDHEQVKDLPAPQDYPGLSMKSLWVKLRS